MNTSLISVIVPVYKTERFLNRCVESLVNQTYKNLEIFLVDDGSPDKCPKMCDDWAQNDGRIKVLHLKNAGVANARNTALSQASGSYIAFADSDDYLEPDMYERLINIAERHNADIVMCDYQINDESRGADTLKAVPKKEAMKCVCMGDYNYGVLWNKLYRSSVVKGLEMPYLKCSQDLPYNYFAFKSSRIIVESGLKLYHYYQNENSTVHKSFSKLKYDAVKARKIILEDVSSELKDYAVYGYVLSLFVFLNSIITTNQCADMADDIRNEILSCKPYIMKSDMFSKKDKLKTKLLSASFAAYKALLKNLK